MILSLVPSGRGNWKRLTLVVHAPAQLFPEIRQQRLEVGERWFMAGRWWRIVEVTP